MNWFDDGRRRLHTARNRLLVCLRRGSPSVSIGGGGGGDFSELKQPWPLKSLFQRSGN
jgi:hypothetical protein